MMVSAIIDATNIIHILYLGPGVKTSYITFSTTTDTFGVNEIINPTNGSTISLGSIAIDSNSKPHIVCEEIKSVTGLR